MHKLDHIVLGANTLQEGTDYVKKIRVVIKRNWLSPYGNSQSCD